jgi:hypothetical protein
MISIAGGMQKGLPLATACSHPGLLLSGQIVQAFGNWLGTDMTLDLVITAGPQTGLSDSNIVVDWKAGTPMSTMIQSTLKTAFPGVPAEINISPQLKLNNDEKGFYGSLLQFSQYLNLLSHKLVPDTSYTGVQVTIQNNKFIVNDGTTKTAPKKILYTDLIGQVTWININQAQVCMPMRADIQFGDWLKLPPGQQQLTGGPTVYRDTMDFTGVWQVLSVHHVGRFRAPSGQAWCTIITAQAEVKEETQ